MDPNERTLGFGSDQLTNLHELTYHQTKFEWTNGRVLQMHLNLDNALQHSIDHILTTFFNVGLLSYFCLAIIRMN